MKVGDSVKQGEALFFDKKNPQVYFSFLVASGVIRDIQYGPQRRLDLVKINITMNAPIEFFSRFKRHF